ARRPEQAAIGAGGNLEIDRIDRGCRAISFGQMNEFEVGRLQQSLTISGRSWGVVCNGRASGAAFARPRGNWLSGPRFLPAMAGADPARAAKMGASSRI